MAIELTSYKVNGLNETLTVMATDEPGSGGAHHVYAVRWDEDDTEGEWDTVIKFHEGPLAESRPNGLSNEALLAIVEHRLRCFQDGKYACHDNALALNTHPSVDGLSTSANAGPEWHAASKELRRSDESGI